MQSNQTVDQFWSPRLIFGLTILFSLIFFNLLSLRWETFSDILNHWAHFVVLAAAIGIILSTLSLQTPYKVAFLSTASVPLTCLGFRVFSDLMLTLVHAGNGPLGGSLSVLQFTGVLLVLMIVGIVLGAVAGAGCYGGLVLQRCINLGRHFRDRWRGQRQHSGAAPVPVPLPRLAAKITLVLGITVAAASVLQSFL
ncbi:MAG: hypothetical protein WAK57_14000 [Desulfobacterales bacterium]